MEICRKHLVRALAQVNSSYRLESIRRLSGRAFRLAVRGPEGATAPFMLLTHGAADRRRNPDIAGDEFRLLQSLKRAGLAVAEPLHLALDHAPPYFIAAHMPGAPRFAADDLSAFCRRLAALLSEIHAFGLACGDISVGGASDGDDCSSVQQADYFNHREHREHRDCLIAWPSLPVEGDRRASLSYLPRQADRIVAYLEGRGAADERIRAAMRRVAHTIKPNGSALLHGDFWLGNLLWQGDRVSGIIDWEDAMLGDPLGDLGKSRLEMLWALGEAAMGEYSEAYLALNPHLDASALPFWDLWGAARLGHYAAFAGDAGRVAAMRRGYEGFVQAAIDALALRQE